MDSDPGLHGIMGHGHVVAVSEPGMTTDGMCFLLEALFKQLRWDYNNDYKPVETLENFRYWYRAVTGDNITKEAADKLLRKGRSVTSQNAKKKSCQ